MNTEKAIYLKVRENLFYKITNGRCISVNTESGLMKRTTCLPSSKIEYVAVIDEKDFEDAKKSINF